MRLYSNPADSEVLFKRMRMFGSSQKLLGRALLYPALLTQMLIPRSEPAAPTSPSSRRPALPAYLSAGKVPYGPLHIGWQGLASSGCALLCLHFLGHDVLLHGEDGLSLALAKHYN